MAQSTHAARPLPAQRAFVVQFPTEAEVTQGPFVGRVEHVVSGQATRFHSLEELLAFMARLLNGVSSEGGN